MIQFLSEYSLIAKKLWTNKKQIWIYYNGKKLFLIVKITPEKYICLINTLKNRFLFYFSKFT